MIIVIKKAELTFNAQYVVFSYEYVRNALIETQVLQSWKKGVSTLCLI